MTKNEILNRMKNDNYCTNFSEETYCDISTYVMEKTGFKLPGEDWKTIFKKYDHVYKRKDWDQILSMYAGCISIPAETYNKLNNKTIRYNGRNFKILFFHGIFATGKRYDGTDNYLAGTTLWIWIDGIKQETVNLTKDGYFDYMTEHGRSSTSIWTLEYCGETIDESFDANDSEKTDDYDFENMMKKIQDEFINGDEYAEDLADTYEAEYDEKPEVCPEFEHIGKYIEKIDGYDWQHDQIANTKMTSDEIDDYLCGMSKTEMMKWLYVLYDMRNIERTDGYCEFVVRNPEWIARRVKTICALTNELDNAAMIVAVLYNYVREVADALNERIFMNTEE